LCWSTSAIRQNTKYESPITYHSKDMTNVKVFTDTQTDKQIERQTDSQAKNYMPLIFRYGGIKILSINFLATDRWTDKSKSV
jgi:hypothetical protein